MPETQSKRIPAYTADGADLFEHDGPVYTIDDDTVNERRDWTLRMTRAADGARSVLISAYGDRKPSEVFISQSAAWSFVAERRMDYAKDALRKAAASAT